ncbi:GNAT family N-acetyltransferase [Pseudonocardia abyssalis]|uniref:GNAT family N-acetyltransferase n=1 Tax=Pseudonocardia abyssalis TaxID=2792008 RepID=UPI001CECCE6B|nr:GNAT family N-acetyltransferase [Pseudonocardia abyssalis]
MVAVAAGEIVGHVRLSRSWVDAPRRLVDVLTLSPRAVRPDRQGRGIGSALPSAAIDAAAQLPAAGGGPR